MVFDIFLMQDDEELFLQRVFLERGDVLIPIVPRMGETVMYKGVSYRVYDVVWGFEIKDNQPLVGVRVLVVKSESLL